MRSSTAIAQFKQTAMDMFPSLWVRWRLLNRPRSAEMELALLSDIVAPDDVTIDVGANLGLYTRRLAQLCARVHAFEPSQAMANILRRSSAGNVIVHEMALSDDASEAELRIPRAGTSLAHSLASLEPAVLAGHDVVAIKVRRARLDAVIEEPVSFVKVDVEGHELNVLRGAQALIARCRPVFLVEAEERHRPGATAALFAFFRALDYDGFFLRGRALCDVAGFDAGRDQDTDVLQADGGRREQRLYINNFFFFPSERATLLPRLPGRSAAGGLAR